MKPLELAALALIAGLIPGGAARSEGMTRSQYEAGAQRIEAEHAAVRASCDRQAASTVGLCIASALNARNVARAELLLALEPSSAHEHGVRVARAQAAYDLALQRCDDRTATGGGCAQEARAGRARALAAARAAAIEANAAANEQAFDARARATAARAGALAAGTEAP
jgi:hypothetical protein